MSQNPSLAKYLLCFVLLIAIYMNKTLPSANSCVFYLQPLRIYGLKTPLREECSVCLLIEFVLKEYIVFVYLWTLRV